MIEPQIFATPSAIGEALARRILTGIAAARAADKPYLLGCPSGRSPKPVYEAMAKQLAAAPADISHLRIVLMDEYLVSDGSRLVWPPIDAHFSCRRFGRREIVDRLNAAASVGVPDENVLVADPADPSAFEEEVSALGGVDYFILASGASDGHVAFNPPGSDRYSRTRLIELAQETRQDNMHTFPDFRTLAEVPTHGVSVGIATIADSKAAGMVVWGEGKRLALQRLLQTTGYDSDWPATVIHVCRNPEILADEAAAGVLAKTG